MYPGIELRTMRYIVAVGVELHFTHAAERVHVAQPSLSKQIRNVEEELGVELFKRDRNKQVEVTEPGRVFIENAQKALLYADRAASMARAASAGQLGKLLLGVSPHVDSGTHSRSAIPKSNFSSLLVWRVNRLNGPCAATSMPA
jgi:DNA-binding transcriptional LysR family regulator